MGIPTQARNDRGAARATGCLLVLVLLLVVSGIGIYRFDVLDRWWPKPTPDPMVEPALIAPPVGLELPEPSPVVGLPAPISPAQPPRLMVGKVRSALQPALRDPDLGKHVVLDVQTRSGQGPAYHVGKPEKFTPASTTKLLTAVAALEALGPDHRFSTVVKQGRGNRVVLVGGGDPYLASEPVAPDLQASTYPERADLQTLAADVAASLTEAGTKRVRLGYDATLFTGPSDNPRWEDSYLPDGVVTPISSLWADQGRASGGNGRVADPPRVAATVFARALRGEGIQVNGAPRAAVAGPGGIELGTVTGAPLSQVVERLIDVSDNEAAEVVARHVGLAVVSDSSFIGGVQGVRQQLQALGAPVQGSRWYDGSGLSRESRLSGELLLDVLRLASAEDRPDLRAAISGLPVAGFTGSLAARFEDGPQAALGRVRAKTGTLVEGGVHGLAGFATDANGTPLLFVVVADRVAVAKTLGARDAIDRIAAELAACTCSRP